MTGPVGCQKTWFDLVKKLGDEGARKELARQLRLAADFVEEGSAFPDVFGCKLFETEPTRPGPSNRFVIGSVSVTLSNPWGG